MHVRAYGPPCNLDPAFEARTPTMGLPNMSTEGKTPPYAT